MTPLLRFSPLALCPLALCAPYAISQASASSGPQNFSGSNSSQIVNVQQNGSGSGLKAFTASDQGVAAVYGRATASSGFTNGLWGIDFSSKGVGVRGEARSTTGPATGIAGYSNSSAGTGVFGQSAFIGLHGVANNGASYDPNKGVGVVGDSSACAPAGSNLPCMPITEAIGVLGRANGGVPAVFEQDYWDGGTNLIIGRVANCCAGKNGAMTVFRVDDGGQVFGSAFMTSGADFAESVSVRGTRSEYAAGDVLVIDTDATRKLTRTTTPYSTLVAGIYSSQPGMLASPYRMDQTPKSDVPLAVVGIVPCKVTTENGSIRAGDLLVTSSRQGYAMKGTDRSRMVGAVLGKALQPLNSGEGVVQVLVTLQ